MSRDVDRDIVDMLRKDSLSFISDEDKRKADEDYKRSIQDEIYEDLADKELDLETCLDVIRYIEEGLIRHVTINY